MPAIGLILIVNTTHTGADSCHHLVRNGLKEVAQYRYGKLRSEYLYGVSFVAIDTRDVYHADIHADITYIRSEEHTSELQSRQYPVCRLLLEKKKKGKHMRRQCRTTERQGHKDTTYRPGLLIQSTQ